MASDQATESARFSSFMKWHLRKILHQIWKLITERGGEGGDADASNEAKHKKSDALMMSGVNRMSSFPANIKHYTHIISRARN